MAKLSIDKETMQVEIKGTGIEILVLLTILATNVLEEFEEDGFEKEEVWDDINKVMEFNNYRKEKE